MTRIKSPPPVATSTSQKPVPAAAAAPAAPDLTQGWAARAPRAGAVPARTAPALDASRAAADVQELHEAMHGGTTGLGTDEARLFAVLAGRSAEHLATVGRLYQEHFGLSLDKELTSELSGHELKRAQALLAGDPVQGQVEVLRQATSGAFGAHRKDLLAGLRQLPPDMVPEVKQRFADHGEPLEKALSRALTGPAHDEALALLRGDLLAADAAHLDEVLSIEHKPAAAIELLQHTPTDQVAALAAAYHARSGRTLTADLTARTRGTERDLAVALASGDARGVAVASLKHSVEGRFMGLGKDASGALAVLQGRSKEERAALETAYQQKYGTSLKADVVDRFGGRDGDRVAQALRGTLGEVEQLQIAVKGLGADQKAVLRVLSGRSKEQVEKLRADFLAHTGEPLDAMLTRELSGRGRFEARLALEGTATTADEAVHQARLRRDFEREGMLNTVSRRLLDRVSQSGHRLDRAVIQAEAELEQGKATGHVDEARVAALVGGAVGEAKTYAAQKDTVAQAAGTGAAVAVTFATAGAGAPLLVSALSGAAATVATRGALEGQAYSRFDAVHDVTTGLVAGVSGGVGSALAGKAASTVLGRAAQGAVEGGTAGFMQGTADAALREETWAGGVAEGLFSVARAGGKSALTSAAMRGAGTVVNEITPGMNRVVATRFPGEKKPIDLAKYKSDAATRKAADAVLGKNVVATEGAYAKFVRVQRPDLAKVPVSDLVGVRVYTATGFTQMNQGLRGAAASLKKTAPVVKTAASGLSQLPGYTGTVYRGVNLDAARLAKYKVGEVICEPGFTSTTAEKALVLGKGLDATSFNKNGMLVIKSRGGGKDVSFLSTFAEEKEVLFAPGTEFKVLKQAFDKKLNKQVVYLEEVP